mmetsp:Transcript_44647/g.89177  ORF Transcript_44647/g.89177 Transcript_44647/m.89177 type:complete len:84 (-) Transcript_44647:353-604(-)
MVQAPFDTSGGFDKHVSRMREMRAGHDQRATDSQDDFSAELRNAGRCQSPQAATQPSPPKMATMERMDGGTDNSTTILLQLDP